MNIRPLNGFIEINNTPVARIIVPEWRHKDVERALTDNDEAHREGFKEGEAHGYEAGLDEGAEKALEEFNRVLDRAEDDGIITEKQAAKILGLIDA